MSSLKTCVYVSKAEALIKPDQDKKLKAFFLETDVRDENRLCHLVKVAQKHFVTVILTCPEASAFDHRFLNSAAAWTELITNFTGRGHCRCSMSNLLI